MGLFVNSGQYDRNLHVCGEMVLNVYYEILFLKE
jgi:hypothetical protein